jgi:hypothetical protein
MKLSLDHTQRLNLHSLMGAQRASLDDLRMLWKLQDRIDLSAQEKAAINYKVTLVNGMQQVQWDVSKILPLEVYEFNEQESARLTKMLKEWQPGYLIGADRQWLEPLLAQIDGLLTEGKVDGKATGAGLGQLARPPLAQ